MKNDIISYNLLFFNPTKQVFTLLESIYHSFDEIAKRRRVFKVETIGDCYVAVCGLPDPRKDHAGMYYKFTLSRVIYNLKYYFLIFILFLC